ncbi:hypothetical protein, partial [Gluconobacter kondonii]|uniref:hypothetical protein n=1 Tax=Gluconobacter kondonii TaxID=941463 RepID=UPI001B8D4F32
FRKTTAFHSSVSFSIGLYFKMVTFPGSTSFQNSGDVLLQPQKGILFLQDTVCRKINDISHEPAAAGLSTAGYASA